MAARPREQRYMPVLAGLLLLTLGVTVWLLFTMSLAPAGPSAPAAAVTMLINSNAANTQAQKAVNGDAAAFAALQTTAKLLNNIQTAGLSEKQRAQLGQIRAAATELLDGQGDVDALQAAVARLEEGAPKFNDAVYALQGELAIQREPLITAHLERLRLLGDSLPALAQGLLAGRSVDQQMLDRQMEIQQIIRALQAGDPALGIAAVEGVETGQAIAALARRADQVSDGVRDALKFAGRIAVVREAGQKLDTLVSSLEAVAEDSAVSASLSAGDAQAQWQRIYALLGAAVFIVLMMLLLWTRAARQSSKAEQLAEQSEGDQQAILRLLDELGNLADGDLTVQATVSEDVTGAIADSINYAIEAMRDLVATINDGAILVEDATKQTQASARSLEAASEAQSRQVKAATEAVHNMAASIDEISGNAERSSDVARHSVDIAHKGGDAVRRTIAGMNTIRETIQDTSKRIKRLGESSQEIGDIVELINDIADQTNILALNASIQASMAGEAGRGFAVVADEVQRLAERSANATKQIEVLVSTIQSDTNEAVVSMERSTTDVVGGALLAENAGAALEEIEQVSNQIAMLVQNISGSSREQTDGAKTVLQIVERLNQISNETDASAATTANFVSKLSDLASQLRESVSGFVLPGQQERDRSAGKEPAASATGQNQGEDDFANQTSKLFADQNTA